MNLVSFTDQTKMIRLISYYYDKTYVVTLI